MVLPAKQYLSDRDVACRYSVRDSLAMDKGRAVTATGQDRRQHSLNLVDLLDYEQKLS